MRYRTATQDKPRMLEAMLSALGRLAGTAKNIHRRRTERSMRLCETLSLGDRRTLALVCVEREKLLVGAAGSSITLLARFPEAKPRDSGATGGDADCLEEAFDAEEYKQWR